MANRDRAFVAWLISGLLVLSLLSLAVYKTPYFQNCLGEYEESYQAANKPAEKPRSSPIPIGLATIVLVVVTGMLALYTARLWGETRRLAIETSEASRKQRRQTTLALGISRTSSAQQARDMRESLDVAGRAADATKASAEASARSVDASVVSSMPILVPFIADRGERLYPGDLINQPYTPRLNFVLQNLGATPAVVREVRASLFLVTDDRLPDVDVTTLPTIHQEIIVPGNLLGNAAKIPGSGNECTPFRPIS